MGRGGTTSTNASDPAGALNTFTTLQHLANQGLNWVAYAAPERLPSSAQAALDRSEGVLLFLALGPKFGSLTRFVQGSQDNPFDRRATDLVQTFVAAELTPNDPRARLVYPGAHTSLDLRGCLIAAQAQYPSRLGIGIRPDCGTWFAVRAAVATTLSDVQHQALQHRYPPLAIHEPSPCDTCSETPCRTACPADAVAQTIELMRCATQRVVPESSCASRCAAREACPIGHEFQYPTEQINYHYGVSLPMLRSWLGSLKS